MLHDEPGPLEVVTAPLYPQPARDNALAAGASAALAGYEAGAGPMGDATGQLGGQVGWLRGQGAAIGSELDGLTPTWNAVRPTSSALALQTVLASPDPLNAAATTYPTHPPLNPTPPPTNQFEGQVSSALQTLYGYVQNFMLWWNVNLPKG